MDFTIPEYYRFTGRSLPATRTVAASIHSARPRLHCTSNPDEDEGILVDAEDIDMDLEPNNPRSNREDAQEIAPDHGYIAILRVAAAAEQRFVARNTYEAVRKGDLARTVAALHRQRPDEHLKQALRHLTFRADFDSLMQCGLLESLNVDPQDAGSSK